MTNKIEQDNRVGVERLVSTECEQMYGMANSMVGSIGKESVTSVSSEGEPFIEFVFFTKNKTGIIPIWEKFIASDINVARYVLGYNCHSQSQFYPLKIYWRTKPEMIKSKGFYQWYARFLISADTKDAPSGELRPDLQKGLYESWVVHYQEGLKWSLSHYPPRGSS